MDRSIDRWVDYQCLLLHQIRSITHTWSAILGTFKSHDRKEFKRHAPNMLELFCHQEYTWRYGPGIMLGRHGLRQLFVETCALSRSVFSGKNVCEASLEKHLLGRRWEEDALRWIIDAPDLLLHTHPSGFDLILNRTVGSLIRTYNGTN